MKHEESKKSATNGHAFLSLKYVQQLFGQRVMKLQLQWPFNAATTLSIIAIVISFLQLFLSAPILTRIYFAPALVITGSGSSLEEKASTGVFELVNYGRATANNVQIGLMVKAHQSVSVLPSINTKIFNDDSKTLFKNVRIEVPKLHPKESILITVLTASNEKRLPADLVKFLQDTGVNEMPMLSYLRSDEGIGENLTSGFDKSLWVKQNPSSQTDGPIKQTQ